MSVFLRPSCSTLLGTGTTQRLNGAISRRLLFGRIGKSSAVETNPEVKSALHEFFDKTSAADTEVKTGRAWKEAELRQLSNEKLHRLWYILYKERNMLKTMAQAAEDEYEMMPNPERVDKVEESMERLRAIVDERNSAMVQLETGQTGERPAWSVTTPLGFTDNAPPHDVGIPPPTTQGAINPTQHYVVPHLVPHQFVPVPYYFPHAALQGVALPAAAAQQVQVAQAQVAPKQLNDTQDVPAPNVEARVLPAPQPVAAPTPVETHTTEPVAEEEKTAEREETASPEIVVEAEKIQAAVASTAASAVQETRSRASASLSSQQSADDGGKGKEAKPEQTGPKSWASLLHGTTTAQKAIVVDATEEEEVVYASSSQKGSQKPHNNAQQGQRIHVGPRADWQNALKVAEICEIPLIHRGVPFTLRGMTNTGNRCYVNSTLQALLTCPPLFHLLRVFSSAMNPKRQRTCTPTIDAFVYLAHEFGRNKAGPRNSDPDAVVCGPPFVPHYIYDALATLRTDSFRTRQEDAEECLSLLVNALHDECVACCNAKASVRGNSNSMGSSHDSEHDSDWHQVGASKRQVTVTRTHESSASPITEIFGGTLRYAVHAPQTKESVTLQPFFVLQLDVHDAAVVNINTAMAYTMRKEILRDFESNNKAVDATRRCHIEHLPFVMILHLKYFLYEESGGLRKLLKKVDYGVDLVIDRDLVSPNERRGMRGQGREMYKLSAVIFHHGTRAEGGHYTTAVFHAGSWFHMDDQNVSRLSTVALLSFCNNTPDTVPYLLFYRRVDVLSRGQPQQPRQQQRQQNYQQQPQ